MYGPLYFRIVKGENAQILKINQRIFMPVCNLIYRPEAESQIAMSTTASKTGWEVP